MIPRFDPVLFDFDGTLIDSGTGIKNCAVYALHTIGIEEHDWDKLDYFVGPPLWDSFRALYSVTEEQADALVAAYRKRYRESGVYECRVYPGVPELLEALRRAGVRLGVASSKPRLFVEQILARFHLAEYFDAVSGIGLLQRDSDKTVLIQTAMARLNGGASERALMVGDRRFDIEGAKGAGVKSAGVLYGYGSREELEQAGANYLAARPAALTDIILI